LEGSFQGTTRLSRKALHHDPHLMPELGEAAGDLADMHGSAMIRGEGDVRRYVEDSHDVLGRVTLAAKLAIEYAEDRASRA
jgi:hypothetical protein